MSHELFEVFGMLGVGVGLSALLHRAVQPWLLRLAASVSDLAQRSARRQRPVVGLDENSMAPRSAGASRIDSTL